MAATGNEAVKLSQLKELYKVASDTSYGVVRLVSDEDLMSLIGGSSVEVGSFELKDSNLIADFNISCGLSSNGTITIDGSFGTTQTVDGPATLFTIPEGYRPTSTTSARIRRQGGSYDTMTLRVGTDGGYWSYIRSKPCFVLYLGNRDVIRNRHAGTGRASFCNGHHRPTAQDADEWR